MLPLRKPGAIAVAALALAALPATASAHDGNHPFTNCTEAYSSGYANISAGDEHYGKHLDRDGDGIGCDSPPPGFEQADDDKTDTGNTGNTGNTETTDPATPQTPDLAETGGSDTTVYLATGGSVALLAGGAVLMAARRRRTDR
ncbi:excalibur calcium-binding domain-containing protein [Streptomyces sp. NPDC001658]